MNKKLYYIPAFMFLLANLYGFIVSKTPFVMGIKHGMSYTFMFGLFQSKEFDTMIEPLIKSGSFECGQFFGVVGCASLYVFGVIFLSLHLSNK